jgi:FtsX-like permease family protein
VTPHVFRAHVGSVSTAILLSVAVPLTQVRTLDEVARQATARPRFRAVAVGTFAGLALLLTMIGVFGIIAYSVQQRVREFAVRMALGASVTDVLGLVVGSAVRVIAAGAVIGLALGGLDSVAGNHPVRRAAVRLGHVCVRDDCGGADRDGRDCRSRLACGPHRSGGCATKRVSLLRVSREGGLDDAF